MKDETWKALNNAGMGVHNALELIKEARDTDDSERREHMRHTAAGMLRRMADRVEGSGSGGGALPSARPIVIIESPYAGDLERNARYLDACLLDSLRRGEAPFASHGLYTRPGVLNDADPVERELGIQAGFAFRCVASRTVVYTDLGISEGMKLGIADALQMGGIVEYRKIGGWEGLVLNERGNL